MFKFLNLTQINTTLKQAIFVLILIASATLSPGQAKADSLTGDEIRKAISGHTLVLSAMGIKLPVSYRTNGTMAGSLPSYLAALSNESSTRDSGKWWVQGGKLCQRWNHWLDGKTLCFSLSRQGTMINWRAKSGHHGTAQISN